MEEEDEEELERKRRKRERKERKRRKRLKRQRERERERQQRKREKRERREEEERIFVDSFLDKLERVGERYAIHPPTKLQPPRFKIDDGDGAEYINIAAPEEGGEEDRLGLYVRQRSQMYDDMMEMEEGWIENKGEEWQPIDLPSLTFNALDVKNPTTTPIQWKVSMCMCVVFLFQQFMFSNCITIPQQYSYWFTHSPILFLSLHPSLPSLSNLPLSLLSLSPSIRPRESWRVSMQ